MYSHACRLSLLIISLALPAGDALSHSIRQDFGTYADNQGLERQQTVWDFGVEGGAFGPGMNASQFTLNVMRNQYRYTSIADNDYMRELYGTSQRVNLQAALSSSQTWHKTTETRLMGSFGNDAKVKTRIWGAGASQWLRHDTIRISMDVSRTLVDRPLYEILDYDSQTISPPTVVSSSGASVAVRYLATSTTITDYGYGHVVSGDRPVTKTYSFGIRQFIPLTESAVHLNAVRSVNRGFVSISSNYGQVDAWIGEGGWLQSLWTGGSTKLSYRFYREDETTRAYDDEKVFGSDTVSLCYAQEVAKGSVENLNVPMTIRAAGGRYVTNTDIAATTFEFGLTAKF